ncbi:MAG: hypothetical protein KAU20_04525, partial [Nanoarchaeota archaeon]|nr:hypothetical protein [Nanoarchaeota archaeon]
MAEKRVVIIESKTKGAEQSNDALADSYEGIARSADKADASIDSMSTSNTKATATSKNLGESVRDNGGAIALLDSLTGGLASKFRDAAEATKLFNFNLKGVRTALIATGIGALVVALGYVVAHWDDITDAIGITNTGLEKQKRLLEGQQTLLDARLELISSELALEEQVGEISEESLGKQKELLDAQIVIRKEQLRLIEEGGLALKKRQLEAARDNLLLGRGTQLGVDNLTEAVELLEVQAIEATTAINEALLKRGELDVVEEPTPKGPTTEVKEKKSRGIVGFPDIEEVKTFTGELIDISTLASNVITNMQADNLNLLEDMREEHFMNEMFRQDETLRRISDTGMATANLFGALSSLSGENSKEQKGFAIAQVIADSAAAIVATWRGYAGFGPWGTVTAGIQTAAIAAMAKKQIQVINSADSGGGSAG